MGSDQLIELISEISWKLLPVAGLVLLIYVVIFFRRLIETMQSLTKTLDTADKQMKKLDGPLQTVEDLSETVDQVHEASKSAIFKGIQIAKDSLDVVVNKMKKKKTDKQDTIVDTVEIVNEEGNQDES